MKFMQVRLDNERVRALLAGGEVNIRVPNGDVLAVSVRDPERWKGADGMSLLERIIGPRL